MVHFARLLTTHQKWTITQGYQFSHIPKTIPEFSRVSFLFRFFFKVSSDRNVHVRRSLPARWACILGCSAPVGKNVPTMRGVLQHSRILGPRRFFVHHLGQRDLPLARRRDGTFLCISPLPGFPSAVSLSSPHINDGDRRGLHITLIHTHTYQNNEETSTVFCTWRDFSTSNVTIHSVQPVAKCSWKDFFLFSNVKANRRGFPIK